MLAPKRTLYRKYQKGNLKNKAHNCQDLRWAPYGLKSCASGVLSDRTVEAVRRTIRKTLKRQGKLWIRIFPDIPISRKPAEVRMGKGKGSVSFWVCKIRPGQILYEMAGISGQAAEKAAQLAASKINFKTQFVVKQRYNLP